MRGIIYKATNTFNGKVYIGQTVSTLAHRRGEHLKDAKGDSDNQFHLALYQFPNGFTWEVLDEFSGDRKFVIHSLNVAEEYHILKNDSADEAHGYNSTYGGYSSDKFAEHIERKMRVSDGTAKAVLQYGEDGEFIAEFPSLKAVASHLGAQGVQSDTITDGLHYGYQWRIKHNEYFPRKIDAYEKKSRSAGKVAVYDSNGILCDIYASEGAARKATGLHYSTVRKEISDITVRGHQMMPYYLFKCDTDTPPERISINVTQKRRKTQGMPTEPISVLAYDAKSGEFVAEYPSIAEAYRATRVATQTIKCFMRLKQPYTIISPKTKFVWVRKEGEIARSVNIVPFVKKNYEIKMEHRIIQYTLDGEFVKVWDNTHQAAESGADTENLIRNCLTGKRKSPKLNYQWAFYTPDYQQNIGRMEKDTPKKVGRKPNGRQAVQVTRPDERIEEVDKSGKVVAVYRDTADAAEKSGFSQSYICNVLAGRIHYPKRKFRRAK